MKIGNENPDNFIAECYGCAATNLLSMVAFRRKQRISGWLFVCPNCGDKVAGAGFEVKIGDKPGYQHGKS